MMAIYKGYKSITDLSRDSGVNVSTLHYRMQIYGVKGTTVGRMVMLSPVEQRKLLVEPKRGRPRKEE